MVGKQRIFLLLIGFIPLFSSLIFSLINSIYYFFSVIILFFFICIFFVSIKTKKNFIDNILTIERDRWILIIIFVSLFLRFLWILSIPSVPFSDFATYNELGQNLANGEGYTLNGKPTAERMMGYPAFLGILYFTFGYNLFIPKFVNVILSTGIVFLTFLISEKVFDEKTAKISSLLIVLFPAQIFFTGVLCQEILFTFLMLFSIYILIRKDRKEIRFIDVFLSGILTGVALLTRSMLFLVPVFVFMYFFIKKQKGNIKLYNTEKFKKASILTIFFLLGMLLIVSPWVYRNYTLSGRPMLCSLNGDSIWISFNENSTGGYMNSHNYIYPNITEEFERSKILMDYGLNFFFNDPIKVVELGFKKLYILFGSDTTLGSYSCKYESFCRILDERTEISLVVISNTYYIVIAFLFALSMFSLKIKNEKMFFILLIIINWMIIHFFMQAQARYHFPIMPLICIFAAFSFKELLIEKK